MPLFTFILKLVLTAATVWLTVVAFHRTVPWGLFLLITPLVYTGVRLEAGMAAALTIVLVPHVWFLKRNWPAVRAPLLIGLAAVLALGLVARGTLLAILL